jgi:hypothetical protein
MPPARPATVPQTAELMEKAGKVYEPVTYDGAGEGFMRSAEDPATAVEANEQARDQAWHRWRGLLGRLGGAAAGAPRSTATGGQMMRTTARVFSVLPVVLFFSAAGAAAPQGDTDSPPDGTPVSSPTDGGVDLSGQELPAMAQEEAPAHVLARPWYQNIDIWGFGAFWLAKSGADGTQPDAGFLIKEASLFVEAQAWEDVAFFLEFRAPPPLQDQTTSIRTGEVYGHFRNVLHRWGDGLLGIKVGRIDIPFGEEYLWQDAPDNPLISQSGAYPWLPDEGISLYGHLGGIGWVTAVVDGTMGRSLEDDAEKAVAAKLHGTPWKPLYVSVSLMKNGDTATGPLLLGGSLFQPVGAGGASSAGSSPSNKVDPALYELDARLEVARNARLDLSFGQAFVDDRSDSFDRKLTWFSVQPIYHLSNRIYAALRYSEIGTYDADQGYHLGGEFLAGGKRLGYDAKRLQRLSVGAGCELNPHTRLKVEVGRDWYSVIDQSPFDPGADREALVVELAVSF